VRELGAVVAATNEYLQLSIAEDREFMGVILQDDSKYYYTVTPGQRGSDKVSIRLSRPVLRYITALWHTHGSPAKERELFSDIDTQLANTLSRRFYLADPSGKLRVFEPGGRAYSVHQARRMGLPGRHGFAAGRLLYDEGGKAIEIAKERLAEFGGLGTESDGFKVMCIRNPT